MLQPPLESAWLQRFLGGVVVGARVGLIPAHAGKTHTPQHATASAEAHPRSRGENQPAYPVDLIAVGSSPLTRGKRTKTPQSGVHIRLIPAHAGKTQYSRPHPKLRRAHPRSRGENVRAVGQAFTNGGSSPLTRGKPVGGDGAHERGRLIPAHAGKTVVYCLPASAVAAHPRSRGENLHALDASERAWGSSPLTRGKRLW